VTRLAAEVYADVLFFVNCIMNVFVLYITGKIMRKNINRRKLLIGAAVSAALYCAVIFLTPFSVFLNIATAVLILAIGVVIAYHPIHKNRRQLLLTLLTAHLTAFVIGGAAYALYYIFASPYSVFGGGKVTFSFVLLIAATAAVYVTVKLLLAHIQKSFINRQTFYDMRIWLNNVQTDMKGLMDTGNCLLEPISRSPVVVAEAVHLKTVLPANINALYSERRERNIENVMNAFTAGGLATRMKLIPFKAANGESDLLIGFKPDKIELTTEKGILPITDVIIGICNFKLSPEGDYNSLLNPELLNNPKSLTISDTRKHQLR
jgi:stage II sporulation protein GA (sporulation sigma-E factor processing peptidase)